MEKLDYAELKFSVKFLIILKKDIFREYGLISHRMEAIDNFRHVQMTFFSWQYLDS